MNEHFLHQTEPDTAGKWRPPKLSISYSYISDSAVASAIISSAKRIKLLRMLVYFVDRANSMHRGHCA
jgi:hypothetical protein